MFVDDRSGERRREGRARAVLGAADGDGGDDEALETRSASKQTETTVRLSI